MNIHKFFVNHFKKSIVLALSLSLLSITIPLSVHAELAKGYGKGFLEDDKTFNVDYSNGKYYLYDPERNIKTYDESFNPKDTNGKLVQSNSPNFTDPIAVDAHVNMAKVYDFYKNVLGRNSYDGHGALIEQCVRDWEVLARWQRDDNLFIFGALKSKSGHPKPFSSKLIIVAHEFTHAVIASTAKLSYDYGQSGTLNESIADIFGAIISQSWSFEKISGILVPADGGKFVSFGRSLSNPPEFGQADHFSKYNKEKSIDFDDPHFNAGIHNKAGYLLSEGGKHYGITVKGIGRIKTARIYYHALTHSLKPTSDFSDMRKAAIKAAIVLFGPSSIELKSVENAYSAVGIE